MCLHRTLDCCMLAVVTQGQFPESSLAAAAVIPRTHVTQASAVLSSHTAVRCCQTLESRIPGAEPSKKTHLCRTNNSLPPAPASPVQTCSAMKVHQCSKHSRQYEADTRLIQRTQRQLQDKQQTAVMSKLRACCLSRNRVNSGGASAC